MCFLSKKLSPHARLRPARKSAERSIHLPRQPVPALHRVLQSEVVEYIGHSEEDEQSHEGCGLRRRLQRERDERPDRKKRHRQQHEKVRETLRLKVLNLPLMMRPKQTKFVGAF